MIVLDACALIGLLEQNNPHHVNAQTIVDNTEDLIIHPINLAECAVGAIRQGNETLLRRSLRELGITIWQPDSESPYRIARLRASIGLRLPDCCALDAAIETAASLATFDTQLATAARQLGLPVLNS